MTTWSGGFLWEPSGDPEDAQWEGVDASVGFPEVLLRGVAVTGLTRAVSWSRGREWWLAEPTPGTATVELAGRLADSPVPTLALGDELRVENAPLGTLWTGFVDGITEVVIAEEGELQLSTTIGASDALSRLLSAVTYKSLVLAAGTLDARLLALASAAGCPSLPVRILPTDGTLPSLAGVTLTGTSTAPASLGAHLQDCEKASNAIIAVARDGSWLVQPRARLVATPAVVELDPEQLSRATATPERVRNAFTIAGVETVNTPSVTKYGRRAYDVPGGVASTTPPYAAETLAAFATPAPFSSAVVPVRARSEPPVMLNPFDYVRLVSRPPEELHQLMSMSWTAEPDRWTLTAAVDRTQASIAGPGTDPPDPIPPETTTTTATFQCDRSAYVVRTSGGANTGNGASVDLLVGLLSDGHKCRGLVRFPVTFLGKNVKVTSAKLRMHVGQTTCHSYGSSPSVLAYRNAEGWSSGTYATRCSFSGSNAVVWPGPDATGSKAGPKAVASSEGALWELEVGPIVQAWADGAPNHGLQLRGASEESSSNRSPFWSRNAGASGDRPTLVVTYTYEH